MNMKVEMKAKCLKRKVSSDDDSEYEYDSNIKSDEDCELEDFSEKASTSKTKANTKKSTSRKMPLKKLSDQATREKQSSKECKHKCDTGFKMSWSLVDYISDIQNVNVKTVSNVIHLLDAENTIPFIARYRRELTGGMEADKLRDLKETYEALEQVKQKAETIFKSIKKINKLTPVLEKSICSSRTISELEHIYAPLKPGVKGTKAERARKLGLEKAAISLLEGLAIVNISSYINPREEGLTSAKDIKDGLQHIIADIVSKDSFVLEKLRMLKEEVYITLESSKSKVSKQVEKKTGIKGKLIKPTHKGKSNTNGEMERKFENYFQFSCGIRSIKPHQVLAINRGENLKFLTVKIIIPDKLMNHIISFCHRHWLEKGMKYPLRAEICDHAFKDGYARLIQPFLTRQVRADLNRTSVRAAVEVFATNLKNLLLSPPVRGSPILGIDPGFRNGCKIGVVSPTGDMLHTDVIYPQFGQEIEPSNDQHACKLKDLLNAFNCELIALGNGTACRETESWLSALIKGNWFHPLNITYTIVNESGASIYSCSPLAKKEFPTTDPNVISAISLARRVQDPLAELVKVEPEHLGVGMYQHDVPKKQLNTTLDEVVVECVSFVGVDVNTASESVLCRIAGLNAARAAKILEWRSSNGPFLNREQLKEVKGIGAKTFEQCAGFIRIISDTTANQSIKTAAINKSKKIKLGNNQNPLDKTQIHPESYKAANDFIDKCRLSLSSLGSAEFIAAVRVKANESGLSKLAEECSIGEPLMQLIIDGLQQQPGDDLRSEFKRPLFRSGLTSLEDLTPGTYLTGRAVNVTHFGIFVDVGVGVDGLIPISKLCNAKIQLGDHVEVSVLSIERQRKRLALNLVRVL